MRSTRAAAARSTCTPLWTATTGGAIDSSPAVANGVVYVGSGDHELYAFNASGCGTTTCPPSWTATTGGAIDSSPAVANGVVYVGSDDNKLYAFNASGCGSGTCSQLWTSVLTGGWVESSPAIANGVVYVGSDDAKLYAYNASGCGSSTCSPSWTATTGSEVQSSPAVANGVVYVGSHDSRLWAFSPCSNPESSAGFAPCDIQNAYQLPSTVGGSGETVAIVDAHDDPNAASDLAQYRSSFGLPSCTTSNGCFRKVNAAGQASNYPAADAGWALEISLDLDMVSASCPNCKILLVEGNNTIANLATAEDTAASLGANVISNSYSTNESSAVLAYDSHYKHAGIPSVAATGDCGYAEGPQWPAVIPTVTAVGGTTLTRTTSGRGWAEQVWNATDSGCVSVTGSNFGAPGSGCSTLETKPSWQHDTGCSRRTIADVAAVAEDVAVYDTYGYGGWVTVGGTSAATPIIASTYALGHDTNGPSDIYAHPSLLFDVTSGNDGSCGGSYLCTATAGYDGPTGLGTPCGAGAFGGAIPSPGGCGGLASSTSIAATITPLVAHQYVPACKTAPPSGVRCDADIRARQ